MLDRPTIRSANDFGELAAHPERVQEPNSATVVVATGSVVAPIAMFKEFSRVPGAPAELIDFVEALLEEEYAFAMSDRLAELPLRHTIGPEDLQFLEVPFLKPSSRNQRIRR